jgi:hypothetical protein
VKAGTPARTVLLSALALALFSTLFTIAAWYDWWPRLPPGALHDTDLWIGFIGGAALLAILVRAGKRRVESPEPGLDSPKGEGGAGSTTSEP